MNPAGPKLLLISDGPGTATGLGGQSLLVYEAAVEAGFQVLVANLCIQEDRPFPPPFFHAGGMIPEYLVDVPLRADQLGYVLAEFEPDHIVALCDGWMLGAMVSMPRRVREKLHFWTTADHEFFPESFRVLVESAASLVFMAEFGRDSWGPGLDRKGKRTIMIPHAVEGSIFRPYPIGSPAADRVEKAKRFFGVDGHFVALHIGRNQHRKQQPLLIEGWSRFVQRLAPQDRAKVTLYLHTEEHGAMLAAVNGDPYMNVMSVLMSGWNLPRYIARNYSAEIAKTIRFSERGGPRDAVAEMHNVSDVHVSASCGEGFGVCTIEAQACGRAVIISDNTTTPELVGGRDAGKGLHGSVYEPGASLGVAPFGWRVPCSSFFVQPDFSGKRPLIDVDRLADALHDAWSFWRAGELNTAAAVARRQEWTLARYEWLAVKNRWKALFAEIVAGNVDGLGPRAEVK